MNMLKLIIPLVLCVIAPALWAAQYDLSWNKVSGGGATFMTGGNFSLGGTTGQHDAGPLVRSNYELNGGFWATTNHLLLTLLSSASAAPNPAVINTNVTFFVADNIPAATITWDFGDGSVPVTTTGGAVMHAYASTGTFTATLSIVDVASGQMYSQNISIAVGTAADVDSDGFITELENALGTDPLNINSTPFGGASAGVPQPIVISKVSVKLNFTKSGTDLISLSGLLPVPMGYSIAGKTAVVYLGGVTKSFTLDAKGKSPKANDSFGIKIKAVKGVIPAQSAPFTTKFLKGSFSAALVDEGLDGSVTVKNGARDVNVIVLFNQTLYTTKKTLSYTATQSKSGSAK